MKKSLSTAILITAGSVAGVGIGYGAFILWKQVGKNKEESYINQTWIDTAKGAAEDIYGVKLIEASIIENKKDTKVMFLGKVGLDVLARRIKNELNYGPEISGLKDIVIGDANVVGKEANGVYYPLTHEIFINTENIRNKGFDLSKTPTAPEDIANRVALIFDIIFHEYGHYLTDTYLNSLPLTSTKASQWIFDRSGIKSHWDKDFVTNLKRIMYNSDVKYANGGLISGRYTSVGEDFTAKQLFELTNAQNKTPITTALARKHYVFSPHTSPYKLNDKSIITTKHLKYIYSLQELVTRKYQQLCMPVMVTKDYKGQINKANGWFYFPQHGKIVGNATNLLGDAFNYQNGLTPQKTSDRYLQDYVFGKGTTKTTNREIELYNLMDRHMGHSKGDDISMMWYENNETINRNTGRPSGAMSNTNQIRFGGYIPNKTTFQYIGYKNKTGVFTPVAKMQVNDYHYKRKAYLSAPQTLVLDKNKENKFYTTVALDWTKENNNLFISGSSLAGKDLYFANDKAGAGITALTSVRSGDDGFATTYRWNQNISHHKNGFIALLNNGKVSIGGATW